MVVAINTCVQELGINITGVDTSTMDPKLLGDFTDKYGHIQVEFDSQTNNPEKELISKLQATGCVIDVKPFQPEDTQGILH